MGRRQKTNSRHSRASSSPSSSKRKNSLSASNQKQNESQDDSMELDLPSFSKYLHSFGLCIRDVANDGNCFFRAVSDQLYGTEQHHRKLRQRACDYMTRHKESFQHFVDDEQTFDDYVDKMRTDGVWADHLELQAISMACKVNIRIHQSGKPSYDINNHRTKFAPVIHLSYHFGEHYASVRTLETAQLAVPAQHDPFPTISSPQPASEDDRAAERRAERHTAREKHRERQSNHHSYHHEEDQTSYSRYENDHDPIAAVWKKTDIKYREVAALLEQTKHRAHLLRSSEPIGDDGEEIHQTAREIEREMRKLRQQLEDISKRIKQSKSEQHERLRAYDSPLNPHNSHVSFHSTGSSFDSDTTISLSDENESSGPYTIDENDDEHYRRVFKRRAADISNNLEHLDKSIHASSKVVDSLTAKVKSTTRAKHVRGGKKKEQEAKRKERKERKRKEQQRIATGEAAVGEIDYTSAHGRGDIFIQKTY